MTQTSKRALFAAAVLIIIGLAGGFLLFRKGPVKKAPALTAKNQGDSFTFFGLGPETKLSDALRDKLHNLLGDGSVETRTTIDLTLEGVQDFASHFQTLQELNQSLNYRSRQRVEHDTVQLTYRYARKQNVPFDRIRLVFWGDRGVPLFFSLYSKSDGADFIDTIRKKHGAPQVIGDENAAAHTLYWRKENALLIISVAPNRIGVMEYNFGIYYLDNLTALVQTEEKAREAAKKEKGKSGELAF